MVLHGIVLLRIGFQISRLDELEGTLILEVLVTFLPRLTRIFNFRLQNSAACSSAFNTEAYASSRPMYLPTSAMITSSSCRVLLQNSRNARLVSSNGPR